MTRMMTAAAASAFFLFQGLALAQTKSAPMNSVITVRGCVAPAQRDGSLGPKAGATATTDTAIAEANSLEPTGKFILLDAAQTPGVRTPSTAPASSTPARPVSYSLSGHESELARYNASRVEIVGSIAPTVGSGLGGPNAEAADGVQRIRVTSMKKVAGSCSGAKK